MKLISLFVFQILWMAAISASGLAYYYVVPEKKPLKAVIPRSDTMPTSAAHILVLSDNDEFHSHFNLSITARPQELRRFVFAGYLPITEIVTRQSGRYIPSAFSIENLLYANLKIERLMNEYENLRERSESVLEGLDVPYIYGSHEFERLLARQDLAITHEIDRVADQSSLIAGPVLAITRQKDRTDSTPSQQNIQFGSQRRLSFEKPSINYSLQGSPSAPSQAENDAGPAPGPAASEKSVQYGINQNDQLPWLIRVTRSLLNYLYENKIEAVFYFLLLYGIIHLLFASRK